MTRLVARLLRPSLLLFAASAAVAAPSQRFVREGVVVDFSLAPVAGSVAPRDGDPARVRFVISDTTTGKPLTGLHPAAWLSRRTPPGMGSRPRTCSEKIQEFLGGSIFGQADLDLNTFRVLALNDDPSITVVDPLFGFGGTKLLAMPALPGVGTDWALTPDNRLLLVSVPTARAVAVVDTTVWKTTADLALGAAPGRVVVQPDGHYAWVACADGTVAVIDVEQRAVVAHLATGAGPVEIVPTPDSRAVFVVNTAAGTLSAIDVRTLRKSSDLVLGFHPAAAAYSSLAAAIYLTDSAGGTIVAVDVATRAVVARIPAESGIETLRFAPGDRYGLVTAPNRDLLLVLDAASNRIVQRASLPGGPEQVAFSSDIAFIRRRGSANVGMIPVKELGREGHALPVAEFTGGEAAFGPRSALADGLVPAPGESAAVVANPKDKSIYYYMVGMAAPMGNFGNYGREPRAVLVIDRSLREVAPGTYETMADLPAAGEYDAVFFIDSPRLAQCFDVTIAANPSRPSAARDTVQLSPLTVPALVTGQPAQLAFRLAVQPGTTLPPTGPSDLVLTAMLAPGTWHLELPLATAPNGTVTAAFTPPQPGVYYFYASSASLGDAMRHAPCLVLRVNAAASSASVSSR